MGNCPHSNNSEIPTILVDEVIHADALEFLKGLPNDSVDMVFTDPPFGISSSTVITRGKPGMKYQGPDLVLDFGQWDHFASTGAFLRFSYQWLDECVRILKPGRIIASWFDRDLINFLSARLQHKWGFKCKGYFAMLKTNPAPQARKVKWMTGWEEVGLWQKPGGKLVFNWQLGQQSDWMQIPVVSGKERLKGAFPQKPLSVCSLFIAYWTQPGDLILDPFSGTGTISVAAKQLNRHFLAIERDVDLVTLSRKRLGNAAQEFQGLNYE